MTPTLVEELNDLHAAYVVAIGQAMADGEPASAQELASNYHKDAIELIAEREGRQHLLSRVRLAQGPGRLRELMSSFHPQLPMSQQVP